MFGVVTVIKEYADLLRQRLFVLETDHVALHWLKPGVDISVADSLSRATETVLDDGDQSESTANDPYQLTTIPVTMLRSMVLQQAQDAW